MAGPRSSSSASATFSPLIAQYQEIKAAHPGCLLLFRLGDFYELFFDDAERAAPLLNLVLTRRRQKNGPGIPMCGVPWHAHESCVARLVRAGYRVALCEQDEAPAGGGTGGLRRRRVTRVITPGTLTEDALLDPTQSHVLAAYARAGAEAAVAWADVSTGAFFLREAPPGRLTETLAAAAPREVVSDPAENGNADTPFLPTGVVHTAYAGSVDIDWIAVFGFDPQWTGVSRRAAARLVSYVQETQKNTAVRFVAAPSSAVLEMDAAARRALHLISGPGGGREGSLLAAVDRTVTAPGARALAQRLSFPLTDVAAINARLDAVEFFVRHPSSRAAVREILRRAADLERIAQRIGLHCAAPRDLGGLRDTLAESARLIRALQVAETPLPRLLHEAAGTLRPWGHHHPRIDRLQRALQPELPAALRDGEVVAPGVSPALDAARAARDGVRGRLHSLRTAAGAATGLGETLQLRRNAVLGYFFEVPAAHAESLFARPEQFFHRQTLADGARFVTTELAALEVDRAVAQDRAVALEAEAFSDLVTELRPEIENIAAAAQAMIEVDIAAALAETAETVDCVRPAVDESFDFCIQGGRHLAVERALPAPTRFVANSCHLTDPARLWLVTGPNMAGKSTFLRQNALILLLAQAGAFVPADAARLGVADRLFTRIGAEDDIARARSTFRVEMEETAAVLTRATARSFVVLDEIGRGTAARDGAALARACLEHLRDVISCRALFATHYAELAAPAHPRLAAWQMEVQDDRDGVTFTHRVQPGVADRACSLHVARAAGLPEPVIRRAAEILEDPDT